MSHVAYEKMGEPAFFAITSHQRVMSQQGMSHMNESCHIWADGRTSICIWICHVTHTNESRHTYEWVTSYIIESCHIWTNHATYEQMGRPVFAYERVMSRTWMSHVTYERVMSRMNESCHIWTSHATYEQMGRPAFALSSVPITTRRRYCNLNPTKTQPPTPTPYTPDTKRAVSPIRGTTRRRHCNLLLKHCHI